MPKPKPSSAYRSINPAHLKRASKVDNQQIGPYLDSILLEMHSSLDAWRFGKAPADDLQLSLDAFVALFTEAELRGLA